MIDINEIWRPVKGYEGTYEVSNFGRVMALDFKHTGTSRIMNSWSGKDVYLRVNLFCDGKCKTKYVHRLVAEAFLPDYSDNLVVDHKNTDRLNNMVFVDDDGNVIPEKSNLRMCTVKENRNNPVTIDNMLNAKNNNSVNTRVNFFTDKPLPDEVKAKISETYKDKGMVRPVVQASLDGKTVNEFSSAKEAERITGFKRPNIVACCTGRAKSAYGFKWFYKPSPLQSAS